MISRTRVAQNAFLLVAAVGVFAIVAWIALRAVEPVPPPPVPPVKDDVTFDPRVDVRTHPLFSTLRALTRGKVIPTTLGRTNPFLGAEAGLDALLEGGETLGTIEEVSLSGASLVALSEGAERGVLALLQSPGQGAYEVRRFSATEAAKSVGTWSVSLGETALTPIALQEDRSGTVWLLSAGGRIGSLQGDGKPLWGSVALAGIQTGLSPAQVEFVLDGAGRLWFTDGTSVFVGNGSGFERVDLSAQLSASQRQALGAAAEGPVSSALVAPQRLQMLADGRIAVLSKRFMVTFPLSLQGNATVVVVPDDVVAVEPSGALWSVVRAEDGSVRQWVRTVPDGARAFTQLAVLPKQAVNNLRLAAVNTVTSYALDYVPGSTVLWSTLGDAWVAHVLSAVGTQPQDQVVRILADREGMVWGVLAQRGLVLLKP